MPVSGRTQPARGGEDHHQAHHEEKAVIRDRSQIPELAVLAIVLAIAAIASYIHLREVWAHAGAPVPDLGPLLPDGLFAAAWLRIRRRRRQGVEVGGLAWLALGLALALTLAGNVAAAWIAGHRDPLSLVVAGIPAAVFALVWELVTGHGRQAGPSLPTAGEALAGEKAEDAEPQVDTPGEDLADEHGHLQSIEEKVAYLVDEKGYGRPRLAKALGVRDHVAKDLLAAHKRRQESPEEAAV